MSELNPCPFCGGQAIMKIQKHIPNGYDYTPTCQDPSCAGRLTKKWVNEADAIEAWNKRMRADHFREVTKMMAPTADPERKKGKWIKVGHWGRSYKCNQCGNYLDFDGVNAGRGDANFCPNCGARMEWE